jgi:dTDP-4-dehydrorhamnose reductase
MNVLVTGACGLLGAHLSMQFSLRHRITGIDRHPWWGDKPIEVLQGDLRDGALLDAVFASFVPDVVIHCAALVDVDACERDPDLAYEINADVTKKLAARIPSHCLFVYISSDAVFSGNSQFWTEDQRPEPCNAYSRSKLQGETEARKATKHLIVRTNFFGWSSGRKKTSAEWLYKALAGHEPVTLFDDFCFTPIYVADLSRYLSSMVERNCQGLFHIGGKDRVSKYEFGEKMAMQMSVPTDNVMRGKLAEAALHAMRSPDISLSSARAQDLLGFIPPSCDDGIARFLADRGRPLSARVA